MSTPFCVALTLVDGQATLEGLYRFDDRNIKELIEKIEHIPDESVGTYCCAITVETKDGQSFFGESREGAEYYNFNMEQTTELARRVTSETGISQDKVAQLVDLIKDLDQAPNIKALAGLLGSCP